MCPLIYSGIFISCYRFLRRTKAYIVCQHGMIRLGYLKFKNLPLLFKKKSTFTLYFFLARPPSVLNNLYPLVFMTTTEPQLTPPL